MGKQFKSNAHVLTRDDLSLLPRSFLYHLNRLLLLLLFLLFLSFLLLLLPPPPFSLSISRLFFATSSHATAACGRLSSFSSPLLLIFLLFFLLLLPLAFMPAFLRVIATSGSLQTRRKEGPCPRASMSSCFHFLLFPYPHVSSICKFCQVVLLRCFQCNELAFLSHRSLNSIFRRCR